MQAEGVAREHPRDHQAQAWWSLGEPFFGPSRRSRRRSRSGRDGAKKWGQSPGAGLVLRGGAKQFSDAMRRRSRLRLKSCLGGKAPRSRPCKGAGKWLPRSRTQRWAGDESKTLARPRSAPLGVAEGEVGAPPSTRSSALESRRSHDVKCKPGKEVFAESRPRVRKCAARAAH